MWSQRSFLQNVWVQVLSLIALFIIQSSNLPFPLTFSRGSLPFKRMDARIWFGYMVWWSAHVSVPLILGQIHNDSWHGIISFQFLVTFSPSSFFCSYSPGPSACSLVYGMLTSAHLTASCFVAHAFYLCCCVRSHGSYCNATVQRKWTVCKFLNPSVNFTLESKGLAFQKYWYWVWAFGFGKISASPRNTLHKVVPHMCNCSALPDVSSHPIKRMGLC